MLIVESNVRFLEPCFPDEEIKYLHYPCGAEHFGNIISTTNEKITIILNIFPFASPEEFLLNEISEQVLRERLSSFGEILQSTFRKTSKRLSVLSINSELLHLNMNSSVLLNTLMLEFKKSYDVIADIHMMNSIIDGSSSRAQSLQHYYYSKSILTKEAVAKVKTQISQADEKNWYKDLKILILDLDNTLWPGVLLEEGKERILESLDSTPKGNAFLLIQKIILKLKNEYGLLLVAVSKNELGSVQDFLDDDRLLLSQNDFVSVNASWDHKSIVCSRLLNELNLLAGNAVFIDDNPFELGEVQAQLAEINIIQFDGSPFKLVEQLLSILSTFESKTVNVEDKNRTELYRLRSKSKSINRHKKKGDLDDFGDKIILEPVERYIPRIKSLLTKTNQFTLDKVLAEKICAETNDFSEYQMFPYRVIDNYGDHGIVAILGGVFNKDGCFDVQLFVLSCRVFERGIEVKIINDVRNRLLNLNKKLTKIRINFVESEKNLKFMEFAKKFENLSKTPEVIFVNAKKS
jgi:FkbH-like protein